MKTTGIHIKGQERGFTLVELAIVLIVIGLLIGGILKGQELIGNAQITNVVTQMKSIDGAVSTFRETYSAFPGDMGNANARIAGCTADPGCDNPTGAGINNGRIDAAVGAALGTGATTESVEFFQHMRVADLLTGFTGADVGTVAFGISHPSAAIGGGFSVGHTASGNTGQAVVRSGHYLTLQGGTGVITANPDLTPSQAARVDRKIDDGAPQTGSVIGQSVGACTIVSGTATIYDETQANPLCNLKIRIQG